MKSLMCVCLILGGLVLSASAQNPTILDVIMQMGDDANRHQRGTGIFGMDDIDDDGWPEMAVGVHKFGQTWIYRSGPGRLDTTAGYRILGDGPMVKGNINGDGRMDYDTSNWGGNDTIYVYYGKDPSPLKIDSVPNLSINPENLGDDFGESSVRR